MTVFILEIEEDLTPERAAELLVEMEDVLNREGYTIYDTNHETN